MHRPHIQVILAETALPTALRTALERTQATASFLPLGEAVRADPARGADAVVVVVPEDASPLASPLRVLFDRLAENPRTTLVLTPGGPATPLEHPPTVPVTFGDGRDVQDLSVRLSIMLDMRDSLDLLHRGLLANRRSGESLAHQYLSQLRLASQVQRQFLPQALPRFGPASFRVLFRPVDYVSGDIYDVHLLDREHVGIALADASGHGIPAALLTVYIKRALRGKDVDSSGYHILSPGEVLARLNADVLEAQLAECPFVAALYAVLNTRTLELSLARGGAPYPLRRTAGGEVHQLASPGGVLGVLPAFRPPVLTTQLAPGDSVLFYSDGLEPIIAPQAGARRVPHQLVPAAPRIVCAGHAATVRRRAAAGVSDRSPPAATLTTDGGPEGWAAEDDLALRCAWVDVLRQGTGAALARIDSRQRALRRMGYPLDDLTVLLLQIDRQGGTDT